MHRVHRGFSLLHLTLAPAQWVQLSLYFCRVLVVCRPVILGWVKRGINVVLVEICKAVVEPEASISSPSDDEGWVRRSQELIGISGSTATHLYDHSGAILHLFKT